MPSAGGSLVFAGTLPARDAFVIQRLRDAGAIIFLKTNMDELALGSRGLSSLGGQILNPYDVTRNPGGSSGGTAVAVAAGFATVGVGTETGFSIRSPASNTALVGIAPSRGLVSRAGVIPISFTQDRVGVHAKTVADAALLLTYLRGFDPEDLATAESLGHIDAAPLTPRLDGLLAGARIGVLRDLFRAGPGVRSRQPAGRIAARSVPRCRRRARRGSSHRDGSRRADAVAAGQQLRAAARHSTRTCSGADRRVRSRRSPS